IFSAQLEQLDSGNVRIASHGWRSAVGARSRSDRTRSHTSTRPLLMLPKGTRGHVALKRIATCGTAFHIVRFNSALPRRSHLPEFTFATLKLHWRRTFNVQRLTSDVETLC